MAGIGNISQIEMSFMNSMIAFSRAYQNNSKLIEIRPLTEINQPGTSVFIPKSKIVSIIKTKSYCMLKTEYDMFQIDEKQCEKIIDEW